MSTTLMQLSVVCLQLNGKSDPYAVLSVGASMARSSVMKATLEPAWNQARDCVDGQRAT
jgi:Ca2+-dependent lipid-binding protein